MKSSSSSSSILVNSITTDTFINNNFLNLFKFLNTICINDKKSNSLDISGACNVFNLLYQGMIGKSKNNIIRNTNLITLLKASPKAVQRRTAVFIDKSLIYNTNYIHNFKTTNLLYFIPRDEISVNQLNEKICQKFSNYCNKNDNFLESPIKYFYSVHIKDQSWFKGRWKKPFRENATEKKFFYIGNDQKIKIPTMKRDTKKLFTYYDVDKKCDFLSLKYRNKKHIMLIIMPREPLTKKQLADFFIEKISGDDITNFLNKNGAYNSNYCHLTMPKFKIKCEWELGDWDLSNGSKNRNAKFLIASNKYCSYLKIFFDTKNLNLKKMIYKASTGTIDSKLLNLKTKFINKEKGTFTFKKKKMDSDTVNFCNEMKRDMNIDKSFIFLILDNNVVRNVGLFTGK